MTFQSNLKQLFLQSIIHIFDLFSYLPINYFELKYDILSWVKIEKKKDYESKLKIKNKCTDLCT